MGSFEDICLALLTPRLVYDSKCLKAALAGFGTNEVCLIELMCARTANEMDLLKKVYSDGL